MIKRYTVEPSYRLDTHNDFVHYGYDVMEHTYIKGEIHEQKSVKHTILKASADIARFGLEQAAKKSKQWLEVLPPLMQFDALTEQEMLKDYV